MRQEPFDLTSVLARGAAPSSPPFWLVAIILVALVGGAFLVTRFRKR